MKNNDTIQVLLISFWLFTWGIGGSVIDVILSNSGVYSNTGGTLITISIWSSICGLLGLLTWKIYQRSRIDKQPVPEVTILRFNITTSFDRWSRSFDAEFEAQEKAGITVIFRGQKKDSPKEVVAILKAYPGTLKKYINDNLDIVGMSGSKAGSEELSIYLTEET